MVQSASRSGRDAKRSSINGRQTLIRGLSGWAAEWRALVLDLLLPSCCVVCEALSETTDCACRSCWSRVERITGAVCERCGHPRREGASCHWCRQLPQEIRWTRSLAWAGDPTASTMIHALKYSGWHSIARGMASRMATFADSCAAAGAERITLIPVPLSVSRERERGFNQSERIAAWLAPHWSCTLATDVLRRTLFTQSQTRLTPEQRLHNVAHAFVADPLKAAGLTSRSVILIDDVVTTGATLNACADALQRAGIQTFGYITFGRARDPRDQLSSRGHTRNGTSNWHQRVRTDRPSSPSGGQGGSDARPEFRRDQ